MKYPEPRRSDFLVGLKLAVAGAFFGAGFMVIASALSDFPRFASVLPSGDVTTLIAGFGGTLLGSIISYVIARQSSFEIAEKDRVARIEKDRAHAIRAALNVMQITNGIFNIVGHIEAGIEKAEAHGLAEKPLHTKVQSTAGSTVSPIIFDVSDLMPFMQKDDKAIANRCLMLQVEFGVLERSNLTYNRLREELAGIIRPLSILDPETGLTSLEIPAEIRNDFLQRTHELESLICRIYEVARELLIRSSTLCSDISAAGLTKFADYGGFIELEDVDLSRPVASPGLAA